MLKRSRLISIFTTLCVLLSFQTLVPSAFADACGTCVAGGTLACTETISTSNDHSTDLRVLFNEPVSTCAAPTGCATNSVGTGPFYYDFYTFTNNAITTPAANPDCYTVTLNADTCNAQIGSVAYLGTFNPAAPCTNYAGDSGTNFNMGSKSYSFNVPDGATVTVVVTRSGNGSGCGAGGTYTLSVSPCPRSPTAADGQVTGRITDDFGLPLAGTVISLSGTQFRKTITDAYGYYSFANVETNGFYTVRPSLTSYSFSPDEQSFSQLGNTTSAVFTGSRVSNSNPLDTAEYFVRQNYLDFLGREPDESGFNFWSDQIIACGDDLGCIDRKRANVSAAYFFSIEFQKTGGLVDALYRTSFGRRPLYAEFIPDSSSLSRDVVVGRTGWEAKLATNTQAFLQDWVQRLAFQGTYGLMTNDRYVDTLIANTGVSFTAAQRDELVLGLTVGSLSRTDVLQRIAENGLFAQAKQNEMFVMMEYFGYLRRDPDDAGFHFWLNKLNQFNGNFEQAEMVKSFIVSSEYRNRFDH